MNKMKLLMSYNKVNITGINWAKSLIVKLRMTPTWALLLGGTTGGDSSFR